MRTASSKNRSNKKPGLGRVFRVRCRLRSGGLQRLDARGQAALVTSGLVAVDQATRAEAVEDRLGDVERGLGAGGVVGVERLEHLLDGGAQHRALASVAGIAHDGLLGALRGRDRKGVVSGKMVAVRVGLRGRGEM